MNDNPSTAAVPAEAPAPAARRPARGAQGHAGLGPGLQGRPAAAAKPAPGLAVGAAYNPSTAVAAAEAPRLAPAYQPAPAEGHIGQSPGAPLTPRQAMRQLNQTTMALALRHHLAGRLRQAEPLYRAVLRRAPAHSAALINLSALLRVSGRLPESREMAERAVAADPQDPMTFFSLGASLRQLRRDLEAIAAAITPRTSAILINSPNNPTGNEVDPALVLKVAEALPQTIVVVDEAYLDFSSTPSLSTRPGPWGSRRGRRAWRRPSSSSTATCSPTRISVPS